MSFGDRRGGGAMSGSAAQRVMRSVGTRRAGPGLHRRPRLEQRLEPYGVHPASMRAALEAYGRRAHRDAGFIA